MVQNGPPNLAAIQKVQRLFTILDVSTDLVQGIIDWITPNNGTGLGGGIGDYYMGLKPPYQPRYGPMPTIGDLQMVKGFNEAIFNRVSPFLTVMPETAVNANTASPQVLAALEPELMEDQKIVLSIIDARAIRPFTQTTDIDEPSGPRRDRPAPHRRTSTCAASFLRLPAPALMRAPAKLLRQLSIARPTASARSRRGMRNRVQGRLMAQRILALEFVGDRVRAAVAERSWNSFTLAGVYDKVRADDEADLSGALSRLVVEAGQPDIVISALPADLVVKRLLELPFKDARRLHQVVPFALEEHLPFPVDNGAVAFTRVGREGDHTLVMAAMVRKTDLQQSSRFAAEGGTRSEDRHARAARAGCDVHARARTATAPSRWRTWWSRATSRPPRSCWSISDGTPRALRSMPGGLMMSDGSVVSQEAAAPILNSVRQTLLANGEETDQTEVIVAGAAAAYPKVRGLLSDSLAMSVRDGGAFDYTGIFEGTRAQHRQVFIVRRDAARRVAQPSRSI